MSKNNKKRSFKFRKKFVAASFLIAIIAFILLAYYLKGNKRYALLAFLLVPLSTFITELKIKRINFTYSFLVVVVYLILGFTCHWWHPGWVLFLTIPVFYIFFPKGIKTSFLKVSIVDDDEDDEEDEEDEEDEDDEEDKNKNDNYIDL